VVLLASLLSYSPVRAHTTRGNLTPAPPYHQHDSNPHVPGPTAYLWPGAGLGAYSGTADDFPPGYVIPYSPSNSNPSPSAGYSPFGAILTSTADHENTGPLILAVNFTDPCAFGWNDVDNTCGSGVRYMANYTGVTVYIPPEFDLSNLAVSYNPGLIETTFAANANDVAAIWKASLTDPWGPGWWVVSMNGDMHWWPQHDYREWYYMRINDVGAPKIAGKYFFKIFLYDQFFNFVYPGMPRNLIVNGHQCAACNEGSAADPSYSIVPYSGATNATVPVENWPILLVTGEIDPAIITGTIRYGSYNTTLYGNPINLAGRVRAVGVALDPYASGLQTTGRQVEARGYFNQSAMGHFEIEGVAPGIYDLYASAAGYPEQLIASQLTILPGQSIHLDGYLNPGAVVEGQVFSKHLFGDQPWPGQPRPVYVEVYRNDDYVDDNLALESPLNFTHQPYMAYDWDYFAANPAVPTPRPVAFPWAAVASSWGGSYYARSFSPPTLSPDYNSHPSMACGGVVDGCGKPNGVGPAQYWWVDSGGVFTNGGGPSSFIFKFGEKGIYGAPAEFDGHIPQSFASWVNGLTAGQYWVRVWINGYVQTQIDGFTTDVVQFDISRSEWAGDVYVPIDLRVASSIIVLAHFHDQAHTLQDCPISGCLGNTAVGLSRGNRYLIAELRDSSGSLVGMNFTFVLANESAAQVEVNGFGMIGPDTLGVKYSYYNYQGYRDYGLPAGTYQIYLYMRGYLDDEVQSGSVTLSGNPTIVNAHLYRGARLNITVYSVDWETPRVQRPWEFPGAQFRLYVADGSGRTYGYVGYDDLGTPDREGEPARQPVCYMRSSTEPFCPTGSPQVIAPEDSIGSTIVVDSWDGYSAAEVDSPGLTPGQVEFGGGYAPLWDIGGFLISTYDYRFDQSANFTATDALRTGTYFSYGLTYGYVQRREFNLYATEGGTANIRMNLLEGVNLTFRIIFTDEGNLAPTQFNMSMRVRVFDENGNLVATASSKSPDTANLRTDFSSSSFFGLGRFTGENIVPTTTISESYYPDPFTISPSPGPNPQGTDQLTTITADSSADTFLWEGTWPVGVGGASVTGWEGFDSDPSHNGVSAFATFQSNANSWGLEEWKTTIPSNTAEVRVFLAGIYDSFGDPLDAGNSGVLHTLSWKKGRGEAIDSLYYGIRGISSDGGYTGQWSIEVDCWNEYPKPQRGPGIAPPVANWYPAVEGLLEGDSFHLISSGLGETFGFTGDTLSANGLGPYAQKSEWSLPNSAIGTEVSGIYSLAKTGYVSGTVTGFNYFDQLDPESWATVQAKSQQQNITLTQYSWDGHFEMYLPPGSYEVRVGQWGSQGNVGYNASDSKIEVSAGETIVGLQFILQRSRVPLDTTSALSSAMLAATVLISPKLERKGRRTAEESQF
jgi:hypothetical protein